MRRDREAVFAHDALFENVKSVEQSRGKRATNYAVIVRESGRSSIPEAFVVDREAAAYWVARSSRAMTTCRETMPRLTQPAVSKPHAGCRSSPNPSQPHALGITLPF
jgi:hypothetical protein